MKLSVSLSERDLAALDEYIEQMQLPSRSAGIQRAIRLLRGPELAAEYAEAFAEFEATTEQQAWDAAQADGLGDEAW